MPSRRRLGQLMLRRRGELGYTVTQATELAGISVSTWHALERGRRVTAQSRTFYAVDRALRWQPGTAQQLFDGLIDEPTVAHDVETTRHARGVERDGRPADRDQRRPRLLRRRRPTGDPARDQAPPSPDVTSVAGLVHRWPQEPRKPDETPEGARQRAESPPRAARI